MRREFATADGSYDGRLVVYRLEFFYIATKEKVVADEWEVEDWRYPDLDTTLNSRIWIAESL